ncbi:uncharacterized protein LOC143102159 isoform X1 [Alosa pseudoharengus]|uniref:uncharacterized protein LOC143102159 isoform X1 n=1 Tax=Alosa pseudoharengus TaxID=34774 RepID=UPI003F8A1C6E
MGSQDHSPGNTTANPDTDYLSLQNRTSGVTSPITWQLRSNIGPRPDWLLYTLPGLAFLIGIVLFLLVVKTHKRRTGGYHHRGMKGCSSVKQTKNDDMGHTYLTKADTQSYENVLAAIYSNQEGVCFYVQEDDDYVIPDGEDDAAEMFAQNPNSLNLPDTLTEGESYENMEGLYAQPRKRQNNGLEEDGEEDTDTHTHTHNIIVKFSPTDDYLDPDAEKQQWQGGLHSQEQTDTDSYENMDQHFAVHQEDSDDYINPDTDQGHCSGLMSYPQDSGDYYTENSYMTTEDNLMAPIEDREWD